MSDPLTLARAVARRARRVAGRRRDRVALPGQRRPILIVSGPTAGGRLYRGEHRREQLRAAGKETDVCYRHDVDLAPLASRYRCIVLYRVEFDDGVAELLDRAARHGCAVVCDFDDLVFDPDRADLLRELESLESPDRQRAVASIAAQRQTLDACDATTVSTTPLADEARALGARVEVVYNAVGSAMVERAAPAMATRGVSNEIVRLGYLSGTPTHDRDFLEAADSVLWALDRFEQVRLLVAGFLRLDERFERFACRVEHVGHMPFDRLPYVQASVDVNLAPLERGNAFTESKSCLKFLEAGLVAVPTVASPRADFARVIDDGVNGMLGDSDDEWRAALERMVEDPALRGRLGEQARADVLARHTTHATASEAADTLGRFVTGLE